MGGRGHSWIHSATPCPATRYPLAAIQRVFIAGPFDWGATLTARPSRSDTIRAAESRSETARGVGRDVICRRSLRLSAVRHPSRVTMHSRSALQAAHPHGRPEPGRPPARTLENLQELRACHKAWRPQPRVQAELLTQLAAFALQLGAGAMTRGAVVRAPPRCTRWHSATPQAGWDGPARPARQEARHSLFALAAKVVGAWRNAPRVNGHEN